MEEQNWADVIEEIAWGETIAAPLAIGATLSPEQIRAVLASLPSDETLALLIQRDILRNEAYVELFVERYGVYLLRWFHNWCRDRGQAADLTQDILGRFFENRLASFDPRQNFRNYLHQAARNAFRDWLRRESLRRGQPLESIPELQTKESASDPDFDEHLEHALGQLPPLQQRVIRETMKDRGADEIARALEVPRKRVYALLFTARRRLEELLQLPPMTRRYRRAPSV